MNKDLIVNGLSIIFGIGATGFDLIVNGLSIIFGIAAIGYVIYKICGGDISGDL